MSSRKLVILKRGDWASDDRLWKGQFEGKDIGTNVTVLFVCHREVGVPPRWHVHPYDEIFIIRVGHAWRQRANRCISLFAGAAAGAPGELSAGLAALRRALRILNACPFAIRPYPVDRAQNVMIAGIGCTNRYDGYCGQ